MKRGVNIADIFLSYARVDMAKAEGLKDQLEALGLSVFMDVHSFHAGDAFPDRLKHEIDQSGLVLSLWNDYALSREWVRIECEQAIDQRKLLPIEIGAISDRRLTVELSKLHRLDLSDFEGDPNHKGWTDLVRSIAHKLDRPELVKARRDIESSAHRTQQLEAELSQLNQAMAANRKGMLGPYKSALLAALVGIFLYVLLGNLVANIVMAIDIDSAWNYEYSLAVQRIALSVMIFITLAIISLAAILVARSARYRASLLGLALFVCLYGSISIGSLWVIDVYFILPGLSSNLADVLFEATWGYPFFRTFEYVRYYSLSFAETLLLAGAAHLLVTQSHKRLTRLKPVEPTAA